MFSISTRLRYWQSKRQPNLPNKAQQRFWVKWLDKCKHVNLPDYVLISAHARELVEADGLHTKSWRRRFQVWGYEAHYWFLRAHDHGGVVRQDRCMLVLRRQDDSVPKVRLPEIIDTEGGPRTARNMLKPMDNNNKRNLKTPVKTRTLHLSEPYDSRSTPHTAMQPRKE